MRLYLGLGVATAGLAALGELVLGPGGATLALSYEALALVVVAHVSVLILWRVRRERGPDPLLDERYSVARRDAVITTIVGLLAFRRLTEVPVPPELITVALLVALLAVPVYGLRYLLWYWRGEFDRH